METGAKQRVTTSPTSAPGIAARMLSSCDGSSKARLAASSSGIVSSCVRHRSCNRGAGAHADERRIGRTAVQTAVLGEHTISADRIGRMIGQPLRAVFRTALRPHTSPFTSSTPKGSRLHPDARVLRGTTRGHLRTETRGPTQRCRRSRRRGGSPPPSPPTMRCGPHGPRPFGGIGVPLTQRTRADLERQRNLGYSVKVCVKRERAVPRQ